MLNWFKRKKRKVQITAQEIVPMKPIHYSPKIIMAWSQSISGNKEITTWLNTNGYKELAMATSAILLKDEARDWLQKNGFPHLLAMINGAEGNASAQQWLKTHGFETLYHIAQAVESEPDSWRWLKENVTQDLFILAQSIKKIKDKIEENHNDIHSFGQDF
tara:strand:+ start:5958 stop:6440 length:483 start_codon:yes stop_codon:yes gene_type:complete